MSEALDRVNRYVHQEHERRARTAAMKSEAETDLMAFIRMVWPILEPETPLIEGWILEAMVDLLMAAADSHLSGTGALNRLCINVPPGSMKSTLLNVMLPAWLWGPCNRPSLRFISASYSTDVPERDNLRFARVIKHPTYQACWGDRMTLVREGAGLVENSHTGWKRVTSTGGGITGHRADFLCLDDLNNPGNVESDEVRSTTVRWVREIMPDRLNSLERSVIINIQQRTHQEDATGTLLEHGQGYTFLCVPMEFDPLRIGTVVLRRNEAGEPAETWIDPRALDEHGVMLAGLTENERGEPAVTFGSPMAQAEGESCWPERFGDEAIRALKAEKGAYAWDAQFNQIPGVRGGSVIKREWWKLWRDDYPDFGTVVVSVDTAIEERETADYNAVTVWGAFEGVAGEPLLLLIAAWRIRCSLAELARRLSETCRERHADYLLLEAKTRGKDVHDEVVRLYQNNAWETVLVKPQGDKVSRLRAVDHLFSGDQRIDPVTKLEVYEGGIVYAPDREWADDVIAETAQFPYGSHDDYVDTVSQALGWVRKNGVVLRKVEFEEREVERQRYRKPITVPYAITGG